MVLSLFPAAAFAADDGETPNVNPATGREAGPAGDQRVALMVYGKSVTDALTTAGYSFDDFMAAVQSEAQGVLANEKIPDVEVYLVNDANQEYKLDTSGQSVIAAAAKDILNGMADNLDTTNRIIEETTAIQEEVQEAVSNVVSNVVSAAVKAVTGIGKWLVKMGTRP